MAGKRPCSSVDKNNDNLKRSSSSISGKKQEKRVSDASSIVGDDLTLRSNKKKQTQTSLFAFWGKHLVRTKTTATKTPVTKSAKQPTRKIAAEATGTTVIVTPSPRLEQKKYTESTSDVYKKFNGSNEKRVYDQNRTQKNVEITNDQNVKVVTSRDANPRNSMEITLSGEKSPAAITPCKFPLSPEAEENKKIPCLTKEKHANDRGEPKPTKPSNDFHTKNNKNTADCPLSAPIHRNYDDDSPRSAPHSLSEYEQLRLRNIERNNARLAALGLLTTTTATATNDHSNRRRPPRKRPKIHKQTQHVSLRRSSRNRNPKTERRDTRDGSTTDSVKLKMETIKEPETDEEEYYTVSPLLQYEMSRTESSSHGSAVTNSAAAPSLSVDTTAGRSPSSSNMCLSVTGPRFVPPKGLTAIYSLEFWGGIGSGLSSLSNSNWLVGAGKAGMIALWDTNTANAASPNRNDGKNNATNNPTDEAIVDPVLSWKAHSGRWIADASFLPGSTKSTKETTPSRLVTAGNDGTLCLWDLSTVSFSTGAPKILHRTGKSYHGSGIFCMDATSSSSLFDTNNNKSSDGSNHNHGNSFDILIGTGSKDKSVAVSSLESLQATGGRGEPLWRSRFHTSKVGCVKLKGRGSTILASASDDGFVAIHDFRTNGCSSDSSSLVAKLGDAHDRPHSVLWDPSNDFLLVTAGLDPIVKVWDQRNVSEPLACLQGHVPTSTSRCKKIHRPVFFDPGFPAFATNPHHLMGQRASPFLLTGGQGSSSVSVYQLGSNCRGKDEVSSFLQQQPSSLFSRGKLPADCGDSGCIAVNGKQMAVAVDGGEIMLLQPTDANAIVDHRADR